MNGATHNVIEDILQKHEIMVLDGAMATELERHGCDLNDSLWSARVLLSQPELIYQVHLDYYRAGADCATTSSYQATVDGFLKRGLSEEEALKLIKSTVELARKARDDYWEQEAAGAVGGNREGDGASEQTASSRAANSANRPKPLVAASIGPYGAYLADGSEYVGNYGVSDEVLTEFHRPRMAAVIEAGADLLAFETVPSLQEARVLDALLKEFPGVYAWLSFSLKNETSISEGTPLAECAAAFAQSEQIAAIGMNCAPGAVVTEAIKVLRAHSQKPVIVYPNSGESYNPETKTWHGEGSCPSFLEEAEGWYEAGARIIGGCCRTSPQQIEAIARKWRA
ncbi:homocysteine S-methyltransferase [Paenibacillus sp. BIHB 4019]|uniref:homocysteine S-methyltransferase n=1 Tax=Paenibacillus sp. BIHB 4019 TaxID=1870819 RepID=UPI001558E3CF|nr:homocysteine S-methyltransferase [Paenibacillus sp. BIHB 4019]